MNKVFLDTNYLVYSIDDSSEFYKETKDILDNNEIELFTSSKNISEFLSVMTKKQYSNRISREAILRSVNEFFDSFKILYANEISFKKFQNYLKNINHRD